MSFEKDQSRTSTEIACLGRVENRKDSESLRVGGTTGNLAAVSESSDSSMTQGSCNHVEGSSTGGCDSAFLAGGS